ncbi:MAG: hypothetical protein R3B54_15655 [Bdellovibrionota bacterium]
MSQALTIVKDLRDGLLSANLVGHIDAGSDYSPLQFAGVTQLHLNFKGITLINSAGIQKWVKFMQSIPATIAITFEECPPNIVNQCNLFANFTGGKKVKFQSFQAPFFCETCDDSVDILLQTDQVLSGGKVTIPEPPCPKCQSKMDFDGIEDKYFLFLTR